MLLRGIFFIIIGNLHKSDVFEQYVAIYAKMYYLYKTLVINAI